MEEKAKDILSLFDGMSCLRIALDKLNVNVGNYYASEIDKYAMQVSRANYPDIKHIGDVRNIKGEDYKNIYLLGGGSPCQSFSFAGKRKGMSTKDEIEILTLDHYLELKEQNFEFEGQSYLFWEYMRILNEVKPKYFLLENVMMGERWEKILTNAIGVKPIEINSSLVSAQNRRRLYWTNIGMEPMGLFGDLQHIIKQPKDKKIMLMDVLEKNVDSKYFLSEKQIKYFTDNTQKMKEKGNGFAFKPTTGVGKGNSLTTKAGSRMDDNFIIVHNTMPRSSKTGQGGVGPLSRKDGKTYCLDTGSGTNAIEINNNLVRKLTPIECERLQTVPDNYTNHVSDSQRYKMLGNGWTVDVISHILSYMK